MHPLAVYPIAIADQDPGPALNQGLERRRVSVGLHLEQGDRVFTITHNHVNTPCWYQLVSSM